MGNDGQFKALCETIGRPELAQDERFKTNPQRVVNQSVLRPILDEVFLTQSRQFWSQLLEEAQVPCGPINTIPEALNDPQVVHRQIVRTLPHPTAGEVPLVVTPFRFENAQIRTDRAPPLLGQHTEEILSELGWSGSKINTLREQKVI